MTAVSKINEAIEQVKTLQRDGLDHDPVGIMNAGAVTQAARNREYSIAITALEDARMRITRGLAISHDVLTAVDLQDPAQLKAAKRAKRDGEDDE